MTIEVVRDLYYGKVAGDELVLDVYVPITLGRLASDIQSAQEDSDGLLTPEQFDLAVSAADVQGGRIRVQIEEQRASLSASQTSLQQLEQLQASIQRMAAAAVPHVHGDECPVSDLR